MVGISRVSGLPCGHFTAMREIIYVQAGPLSNYTGTHFWNTQENYFAYDEDDVSIIDHNISFKEGRDDHVRLQVLLAAARGVPTTYSSFIEPAYPVPKTPCFRPEVCERFSQGLSKHLLMHRGFVKQILARLRGICIRKRH